jgi:CRP-like cAMP-binding protein
MAGRHDDTLARLRGLPGFGDWDANELERLALLGDRLEFRPGTCLMRFGVPARQAFLILAGAAARSGPHGVDVLGPGDLVCELEPLTGEPASATVQATDDLTVLVLTATAVLRFRQLRAAALGETGDGVVRWR